MPEEVEITAVTDDLLEWHAVGRVLFESAYSPEDSVYEELILDPSVLNGATMEEKVAE